MGSVKKLTRSISKIMKKEPDKNSELLAEEKFSLHDENEIQVDEFSWTVKIKVPEKDTKVVRTLVAGPKGIRLLVPVTHEEADSFPYRRMTEYSYNERHMIFQFGWHPSKITEETIILHTKDCKDIHSTITKFIKDLLREINVADPDKVINDCTAIRPPKLDMIAQGGRMTRSSPALNSEKDANVGSSVFNKYTFPELDLADDSAKSAPTTPTPGKAGDGSMQKKLRTSKKQASSEPNSPIQEKKKGKIKPVEGANTEPQERKKKRIVVEGKSTSPVGEKKSARKAHKPIFEGFEENNMTLLEGSEETDHTRGKRV